ncbi:MAG: helix-turn-helix transcriptional regulator [Candidatus Saccharimonadaceae bacterium]
MFYKQQEPPQNNVSAVRRAARLSQADLAEAIGVTRQTIIAIEKGNYTPSIVLVLKLTKILKTPVEELFWL